MPKKAAKKKPIKATPRQKKAADLVLENIGKGGIKSQGEILREAGYSAAIAKNPNYVMESDGFRSLMKAAGLDETSLLKKHKELLESSTIDKFIFDGDIPDDIIIATFAEISGVKVIYIRVEKSVTYDKKGRINPKKTKIISKTAYLRVPDKVAQDKALDKAYKLNGSYKEVDGAGGVVAVQINNLLGNKKEEYGI